MLHANCKGKVHGCPILALVVSLPPVCATVGNGKECGTKDIGFGLLYSIGSIARGISVSDEENRKAKCLKGHSKEIKRSSKRYEIAQQVCHAFR